MSYKFRYYSTADLYPLERLIEASYTWCEVPGWGLARHEFSAGLHPAFLKSRNNWQHLTGIWEEDGEIAACAISEGSYGGDVFLLFDARERLEDRELLIRMLEHAETHLSVNQEEKRIRKLELRVPEWHCGLRELAEHRGYQKKDWSENRKVLVFSDEMYQINLPAGYVMTDGRTAPDFYLSNVHMFAFNYCDSYAETGEQAFHEMRQMKHYRPELNLIILDGDGKPVAMSNVWCEPYMKYCELEPMGVVWWERRKGLATALIHESANRVRQMGKYRGMLGGDQRFYDDLGFRQITRDDIYCWQKEIRQSWE